MFKKNMDTSIELPSGQITVISAGTELKGDLSAKGDIRIDGKLIGNLSSSSKVIIGTSGIIQGDITAERAEILGKVFGNLKISDMLVLNGNGEIKGNVYTHQLQMAPSASFNGECHMGGKTEANVVAITNNEIVHAASGE